MLAYEQILTSTRALVHLQSSENSTNNVLNGRTEMFITIVAGSLAGLKFITMGGGTFAHFPYFRSTFMGFGYSL